LNIVRKRGLCALVLVALAVLATGCYASGSGTNLGWTVVSAQGNVVYGALSMGKVIALDSEEGGVEIWAYPAEGAGSPIGCSIAQTQQDDAEKPLGAVYGAPALTDDLVLFASYDGRLYAFDRESGRLEWDFAVDDGIICSVAVHEGVAYFGSSDHKVYALDLDTQELVWNEPFETGNRVWGTPAVDAENVYVGSMDQFVYAIDRGSGREAWRVDIGASVPGSIALTDGTLFVGGVDKRLHALDIKDGAELWASAELEGWIWGEALVENGYVYFGSLGGKVYALNALDGSPRWEPAAVDGALRAGPALLDGQLVVGTDEGILYMIDVETGRAERFYDVGGAVLSTPAIVDGTIYVGTASGKIYALDSSRRNPEVWMYPHQEKK